MRFEGRYRFHDACGRSPLPTRALFGRQSSGKGELGGMEGRPITPLQTASCRRNSEGQVTQQPQFTKMTLPGPGSHSIRSRVGPGAPKGAGSQGEDRLPKRNWDLRRRTVNTERKPSDGTPLCLALHQAPCGLDSLKKGMGTHSNILALKIPWTEKPGGTVHGVAKSRTRLK